MDKLSVQKVLNAGFTIIRKDDYPAPRIKVKTKDKDWSTLEKFNTKAARDRRFDELMTLDLIISDINS